MSTPETFRRRVLLCVCGKTPQVVTETIYGLLQQTPAFVPTEIHVLTTTTGADGVLKELIDRPRVRELYAEYGYADRLPVFGPEQVHVPNGHNRQPLEDIRTADDNATMADDIYSGSQESDHQ